MQYREIKQHHIPNLISVIALLLIDVIAFYLAYILIENKFEYQFEYIYLQLLLLFTISLIYLFRRYNPSPTISRGYESKILIQILYICGVGFIISKILFNATSIDQAQFELIFLHIFIFLVVFFRFCFRSLQRYFLSMGFGGRRTIIIGKGEDAHNIAVEINRNPSLGFSLLGYFDTKPSANIDKYCNYIGNPETIEKYIKENNVHEMIVALEEHEHDKLLDLIGKYNFYDICIKIIPDMYEVISGQVKIDMIRGIPLLDINPDIMTEFQEVFKRIGDVLLSLIGIIVLFPIILIISFLVYISSPGEIFYKQVRVGANGVRFTLAKFRTMYIGSEDKTGPVWSKKQDPRITFIGRVLRKYHLDEIPQLLNVLYGHMSIIGPRPERPEIIEEIIREIPYYTRRLKVKPGLTGWAQIKGGYDETIDDVKNKLKLDFYYIENISILLDIKIILKTLFIVLKGRGQ